MVNGVESAKHYVWSKWDARLQMMDKNDGAMYLQAAPPLKSALRSPQSANKPGRVSKDFGEEYLRQFNNRSGRMLDSISLLEVNK